MKRSLITPGFRAGLLFASLLWLAAVAQEFDRLPLHNHTPGGYEPFRNSSEDQQNYLSFGPDQIDSPPTGFTNALKKKQLTAGWNSLGDTNLKDYEEDHLVPVEVVGDPTSS
jgi:hypothetical protein